MPPMSVTKETLLEFIKEFYRRYGIVPCTGFLAGYYRVTPHTINLKLSQLHDEGSVKRIKAKKINTSYMII